MRQGEIEQTLLTLRKKDVITKQERLDYLAKLKALPKSGTEVKDFADSLPKPTYEQEVLFQMNEQRKLTVSIKNNVQFFAWLTIISFVIGLLIALTGLFGM